MKYDTNGKLIGISGTVQTDKTGALPYTQMTPTGSMQPYSPPSALQMNK